jgi:hypothetical protein
MHLGNSAQVQLQLCWIKATTGMPCPACGTTRAADALMHGRIVEAVLINPMGLPVMLIMLISPAWILADVLLSRDSFFSAFGVIEMKLSSRGLAIALIALVIANWIWNYYKGY